MPLSVLTSSLQQILRLQLKIWMGIPPFLIEFVSLYSVHLHLSEYPHLPLLRDLSEHLRLLLHLLQSHHRVAFLL
jgi:hypothetical protein